MRSFQGKENVSLSSCTNTLSKPRSPSSFSPFLAVLGSHTTMSISWLKMPSAETHQLLPSKSKQVLCVLNQSSAPLPSLLQPLTSYLFPALQDLLWPFPLIHPSPPFSCSSDFSSRETCPGSAIGSDLGSRDKPPTALKSFLLSHHLPCSLLGIICSPDLLVFSLVVIWE